jgi:cysteine desulfurase
MRRIYLDYNASTPIDPVVVAAMRPLLEDHFGNPSSGHWAAVGAKAALEEARGQVAALLGAESDEIVFTSGGSEANNLALEGVAWALKAMGDHIITSAVEHPAVVEPCRFLQQLGFTISVVPVDRFGRIDPDDVRRAITPRTVLISIMHANNEVGTIEPIAEVSRIAREHDILLHTDAAQSVGKIATDVNALGVDLLTIAGHKIYAPKGVGALYVRRGTPLKPHIHGAGHEGGRRAGTESALLAVYGRGAVPARPVLAATAGSLRCPGYPQRASRAPAAEYAQRVVREPGWRRGAGPPRRCCRFHGFRLPYRPCRALPRPEGHASDA